MQQLVDCAKKIVQQESESTFSLKGKTNNTKGSHALKITNYQGLESIEIGATKDPVELPLHLEENKYIPLLIAVLSDESVHKGEVRLTQRRGDGELSEGYSLIIGSITNKQKSETL